RYTAAITNSGAADATGVSLDVTLDPNTSLVPGSTRISPLAFADRYSAVAGAPRTVAAPGLLANDTATPAPTAVAETKPTAAGGSVTIAADGSFTYTPPAGFSGPDTFSYTATNSLGNDTAVVTVTPEAAPAIASTIPASGAADVPANSTITVTFDEPVEASASSFTIACGGPNLPYALSASPAASFTLDPAADLPVSATCTVTVVATQVADTDPLDPPDAMAADYTFSFTTTDPAPEVASTSPVSGATGVATDANITVTFSESVSVTGSAFAIECPAGSPVAFVNTTGSGPATSFTLDPTSDLPAGTACTVTVAAAQVSDQDAVDPPDTMAADYVFSFTTDAAPSVASTTPANGATDVSLSGNITITFSESVSVTGSAFAIECPAGSPVAFVNTTGSGPATNFTLDPTSDLPVNATCTLSVTAAEVADADANDPPDAMAANYTFGFSTADAAPTVTNTTPADGATGVAADATITVTFSESVNASTSSFTLACGGPNLPYALSAAPASSFTLNPSADFAAGATCTVTVVAAEVTDADASDPPDTMAADYTFSFTTDAAPAVTSTTPADNAANVATNTNLTITFSEAVNVAGGWFTIACATSGTRTVADTLVSGGPTTFTINPNADFAAGESCTVTVLAAQVSDQDASDPPTQMAANYVFDFTVDTTPTVTTTSPANGATGVAPSATITVNFSESVNATAASFVLECPAGSPRAYTLSASPASSFTLTPTGGMPPGQICSVTVVGAQVSDADAGDPPDTLVANYLFSFSVPPVANADTYAPQIVGNVGVNTASASGFSVLANDQGPGLTANASGTSAQGGTVTLNPTTGTFSYVPPAGYEGADSFTYTVSNAAGTSAPATVSLTVSGMVWFINTTAGAGDGRLGSPFNSLAAFQAINNGAGNNPAAGDTIFLHESATSYTGPVTLLNGQRLVGQDATASLQTIAGLTPPADSFALPAMNSGNATLTTITSAGAGITVGQNNTIRGLTIGNTTTDIGGTNFGTLTMADVTLNGSGQALNLDTGTLSATFGGITSTSSTAEGLRLVNVGGTLSGGGGSIAGAAGAALVISGGNATITYSGSITQNSNQRLLDIQSTTGGSVTLGGALSGAGNSGIIINNNAGSVSLSSVSLTNTTGTAVTVTNNSGSVGLGVLNITNTTSNQRGLLATGNAGTISATSGTITTGSGVAVEITRASGTTPLSVTLTSVSSSGAANGIVLQNTTGSFAVAGSGGSCTEATPTCTGGRIQSTVGANGASAGNGIYLNNVQGVSLSSMRLNDHANYAIFGTGVNGFTLNNSLVHGVNGQYVAGQTVDNREGSVALRQLSGSVSITANTIRGGAADNLNIINTSGTLSALAISNNIIRDNSNATTTCPPSCGEDGIWLQARGTAVMPSVTISNNQLLYHRGDHVDARAENSASLNLTLSGNTMTGDGGVTEGGTSLGSSVLILAANDADVTFNVTNNTITGAVVTALTIAQSSSTTPSASMTGTVSNNTIGTAGLQDSGSAQGAGMAIDTRGQGATTVNVTGNTVRQYNNQGILVTVGEGNVSAANITLTSNTVSEPGTFGSNGIHLNAGPLSTDTFTMCFQMSGNNIQASGSEGSAGMEDFRLRHRRAGITIRMPGYGGGPYDTAAVVAYGQANNPSAPSGSATTVGSGGGFQNTPGGAACALPLTAAGGQGPGADAITLADLAPVAEAAVARWAASALSADEQALLDAARVTLADLEGGRLGETSGTTVRIDRDAAGWGWFVDTTPADDAEFAGGRAAASSLAHGRVDLLTAVLHELGHVLGRTHTTHASALMASELPTGVRRTPEAAAGKVATAAVASIAIGTLPAGKRVRVTFDVTIANPLPAGASQLSAQGTVSGTGFASVLTDDPDSTGAADPTVTSLARLLYLPVVLADRRQPDLVVDDVRASGGTLSVTIRNAGQGPVTQPFWVDAYIGPRVAPTAVNQTWQMLGSRGVVWGVTGAALPLDPGETLTLTIGDAYYDAAGSEPGGAVAAGTRLYAQVDSANAATTYGGVLESHESSGGAYNNIAGPVTAAAALLNAASAPATAAAGAPLPPRPAQ
ncbi:MAG TPA: Ig-like domain-containing protein, partial [Roseiflexaceae bacterium]|nr:Ig-like domain-containing protein [Roseiflexaceae bacterium]